MILVVTQHASFMYVCPLHEYTKDIHSHRKLYSYLYIDCNLVTRHPDHGHSHKSGGNMVVKYNNIRLNIFVNAFVGLSYGYKRANILLFSQC